MHEDCIIVLSHHYPYLGVYCMDNIDRYAGGTPNLTACVQKLLCQLCTVNVTRVVPCHNFV